MNELDVNGLTPFLAYLEHFCTRYESLRNQLLELINAESLTHGTKFEKYVIDIESLFVQEAVSNNPYGGRKPRRAAAYGAPSFGEPTITLPSHLEKS
jgi:hypothetical protein